MQAGNGILLRELRLGVAARPEAGLSQKRGAPGEGRSRPVLFACLLRAVNDTYGIVGCVRVL